VRERQIEIQKCVTFKIKKKVSEKYNENEAN